MNTTLATTLSQGPGDGAPAPTRIRQMIAAALHRWADLLSATRPERVPPARVGIVSFREDVRAWHLALSREARSALGDERGVDRILGVVHRLRYLPNDETLIEFTRLVPDWTRLHRDFSGYLLRRLVSLRHRGFAPGADFAQVHRWLQQRQRGLTATPFLWDDAVLAADASCLGNGSDGMAPSYAGVRKAAAE